MKNFVKGLNNDEPAFKYMRRKFPHLSDTKIKDGIFVGCRVGTLKFECCKDQTLIRFYTARKKGMGII